MEGKGKSLQGVPAVSGGQKDSQRELLAEDTDGRASGAGERRGRCKEETKEDDYKRN